MSDPVVDAYDVAIILGARLRDDGTPSPAMARRVGHGVDLLRAGRVGALLMTGGATTSPIPEALAMRELALASGAPAASLWVEDRARNTIENALFTAPMARDAGWRRLLVVTDAYHVLRAGYTFRRFGLPVTVAGVRPTSPSRDWWLAYLREGLALPWTVVRVERRRLSRYGYGE